jgi:alpha-L-rhamnosidase
VWLGNGRYFAPRSGSPTSTRTYGYPKLLLQLELEFTDGSTTHIVSDESWRLTTDGPIRANNEYDGEEYDARQELPGWAKAGFNDAAWASAQSVAAPGGRLAAQMMEPIRVMETLRPISMKEVKPGTFIFDMGQNMVGWCRLKVKGPRGTQVSLRHSETLKPDGTLYLANIRGARVTDTYALKGDGMETYEPRFTYHGFRYVEVTGFPGKPTLSSLEGLVVHDAVPKTGDFACSNELLNRIYRNVYWGVRGNYRSIPTDCPQRDERQGWLGDRSAECRGESYLFNIAPLYAKWLQDMADAQKESGSVPDVCPSYWPIYSDNVTWPSSTVIVPGMLYEQAGDRRIIETHYPSMKKWITFMSGFITNNLMPRDTYGDWCVPPEDPKLIHSQDPARKTKGEILGTTYFYHDLTLMARYAAMLGKTEDARQFNDLAERMKAAFNAKYLDAARGQYDNGAQTTAVLPLAFGMVPEESRKKVFDHLVNKMQRETKGHIGTGLVGGQWLMRTLSDNGRPDLAYNIARQTNYPSWGYMLSKDATTIWELWNGDTADPAMNSGNHVMLVGDLIIWFYEYLAGIKPDPEQPAFKHIVMQPHPVGDLKAAWAQYQSPHGMIRSDWRIVKNQFLWNVTVPPNTTATARVPHKDGDTILEGGKPAAEAKGMKLLRKEASAAVYELGSGTYAFTSPWGKPATPAKAK